MRKIFATPLILKDNDFDGEDGGEGCGEELPDGERARNGIGLKGCLEKNEWRGENGSDVEGYPVTEASII